MPAGSATTACPGVGVGEGENKFDGVGEADAKRDGVGVDVVTGGTHAFKTAAPALPFSPTVAAFAGAFPGALTVTSVGCA